MSKKVKTQASSARAATGFGGFGSFQTAASPLSYIAEQPDLSQIAEPNIVVALKSLGKKDSTTKAKALDELLDSLKDNDDLAVLTAWSDIYPRTSIDNSQIVRRNAHTLQGILTSNAGKKIVPLLSKFVPSWLAGTFDSDKSVSKAALDALDKTFPTSEKQDALWKLYKNAIYERVEDSLLTQTALTLSDERTTSPDEAQTKYVRVAGTGVRLLNRLVIEGLDSYDILNEKKLWDFTYHEDPYLRNSVCGLLLTILSKEVQDLDWTVLSSSLIYKGLNRSQVGSARAFVQALVRTTEVRPSVWTSEYSAKTPVSKRLLHFLRQGAQSGPQETWSLLCSLVQKVPREAWNNSSESIFAIVEAYRSGVLLERIYIDVAWSTYIELCLWLCEDVQNADDRDAFIEQNLTPLVTTYVSKSSDEKWRIGGRSNETAISALQSIGDLSNIVLQKTWTLAVDSTIEKMRLSLPESSKEFKTSQDAVVAQAKRLFLIHERSNTMGISKSLRSSLMHAAMELLKTRNGKPYGAASIIQNLAQYCGPSDSTIRNFLENDLDRMLDSPSVEQIVSLALQTDIEVGMKLLQFSSPSANIIRGTEWFLRNASLQQFGHQGLAEMVLDRIGNFESETSRAYAVSVLANPHLSQDGLKTDIISKAIADINSKENQANALSMLEALILHPILMQGLAQSDFGPQLTSKLLVLSDSANTSIADRANALTATMSTASNPASSSVPIIRQQLKGEGECLSILTLTDLGLKCMSTVNPLDLLPNAEDWEAAIESLCSSPMKSSLSITSPLQGAVWMIEADSVKNERCIRDSEDFSLLFRITFFVTKVFTNSKVLIDLSGPRVDALFRWYPVALEIVNEKLTLDDANNVWLGSTPEVLYAASDVLSEGNQLLNSWLGMSSYVQDSLLRGSELEDVSRESYYTALAFHRFVVGLFDVQPQEVLQTYAESFGALHKSNDVLETCALLSALNQHLLGTANGLKVVNELLSNVTQSPTDFLPITYLNILLSGDKSILDKVPQQRLVFLFKSLVGYLKQTQDAKSTSESFRLIAYLVPFVSNIYSEGWEDLVQALSLGWISDEISIMHSMLLVYAQMRRATSADEVNDDLVSAFKTHRSELDNGLLVCLQSLSTPMTNVDQPRSITAGILGRQLTSVTVPDTIDLFSLLSSGQTAVRQAAFDLLHTTIPARQEEISIEIALDEKVAELPEELLQLIGNLDDAQRYLLSWRLVFDHFPRASYRLREAYTTNLKTSEHVEQFLEFFCDKIRITSGRPLDASKFQVVEYEAEKADSSEQDMQWLAVHLYYLSLLYIPSLVKDWFLQQKNRIKQPLEGWTQKHMSSLIVASSMVTVTEWSQSQDKDDRPVEIKASPRGSEIVASIAVDPDSPLISLSITLPSAYPLESPAVLSRTRVGVSEKNWTSWLRTIQIIIFSSGSIVEGLVAFRRNVQGALKGQSECAICYSIIGTDMQTPSKKCGTCKNMFHGVCLFKWFKSSNSSSCPLCRNNFNYA